MTQQAYEYYLMNEQVYAAEMVARFNMERIAALESRDEDGVAQANRNIQIAEQYQSDIEIATLAHYAPAFHIDGWQAVAC